MYPTRFNAGLRYVPVSSASVVATLEPVIAALLVFAVLGERLEQAIYSRWPVGKLASSQRV